MNQVGDIFIFIGPPGAGKGSIASLCVDHFGWMQISTGNLCRKHIAEQTKIGKEIDLIIKSGKLINDELITSMVFDWLNNNIFAAPGIVFDGYPRTQGQAKAFHDLLALKFPYVRVKVVWFTIDDDSVVDRLSSRYVCQNKECQAVYSLPLQSNSMFVDILVCDKCSGSLGRRDDDNEIAVRKRLEIYHEHEQQLISFYEKNNSTIIKIDASQPLEKVFEDFLYSIN